MEEMFIDCFRLKKLDLGDKFDTSQVTNMENMFKNCCDLESLDLGGAFDTSKVTKMKSMFAQCNNLETLKLGDKFDISNVKDLSGMFTACSKLKAIEGRLKLAESNAAQSVQSMFSGNQALKSAPFEAPPNGAAFDGLSAMGWMFFGCKELENADLSGWILPNLTQVHDMFNGCTTLNSVNLSWKGLRTQTDDLSLENIFASVPQTATLEIGSDTSENTKAVMEAIAAKFPGSVTVDGQPYAGAAPVSQPQPPLPLTEAPVPSAAPAPSAPEAAEAPAEVPAAETSPAAGVTLPDAAIPLAATAAAPAAETSPAEDVTVPAPSAAAARVRSAGASPLSALLANRSRSAAAPAAGNPSVVVHPDATPAGSSFTYRVRVKYMGDTGAQSGRIELAFPLPESVSQSQNDTKIQVSDVAYSSGSSGGFLGGRIIKQPYLDTTEPGKPVLRGTFEGLYTGNQIEITITCTNAAKPAGNDGYIYWDAIASTQDGAGSAVSNVYRLWDKPGGAGTAGQCGDGQRWAARPCAKNPDR